jgi:glycosyltransferase involved in cell wall biosynthesis
MISVIVPAYNEEANIGACLESLSHQSLPRDEYEIIVVDGDSKDRTREIAAQWADLVFIQTSRRVGGARNDGAMRAKGDIIATTDADCVVPADWLKRIQDDFNHNTDVVQLYGPVNPIERELKYWVFLGFANNFSRFGYYTRTFYYTLGCNTAFRKDAFLRAGMYKVVDAGDDLEIPNRMKKIGRIMFDNHLWMGFSMRRYQQFGLLKSLFEWTYIVAKGGSSEKRSYSKRDYK